MNGEDRASLPDVLKKWEGIPDRTIIILTAEKLDQHIQRHIESETQAKRIRNSIFVAIATGGSSLVAVIVKTLLGR